VEYKLSELILLPPLSKVTRTGGTAVIAGDVTGTIHATLTSANQAAPSVTSAATGTICSNTNQSYTITSSTGSTTYNWSRAAVGGISNAAATNQTSNPITESLINTTNAPVNVTYVITPTANTCSGSSFNYVVTVNPTPSVTTPSTAAICSGAATNINLTAGVASSFSWTVGTISGGITGASAGSGSTINQTLSNPSNTTAGTVQYIVTPVSTTGSCTGAPYTITVTVNPLPAVYYCCNEEYLQRLRY
jgi:hypothetical protein